MWLVMCVGNTGLRNTNKVSVCQAQRHALYFLNLLGKKLLVIDELMFMVNPRLRARVVT